MKIQGINAGSAMKMVSRAVIMAGVMAFMLAGCGSGGDAEADDGKILSALRQKAGTGDASAQIALGDLYANGYGVVRNYRESHRLRQAAAAAGNLDAKGLVGDDLYFGRGTPQDEEGGMRMMEMAARAGSARACSLLVRAYRTAGYKEKASQFAREFLALMQRAAEQGSAFIRRELGLWYFYGIGVPHDEGKALVLLRQAAQQGDFEATVFLLQKWNVQDWKAEVDPEKALRRIMAVDCTRLESLAKNVSLSEFGRKLFNGKQNEFYQRLKMAAENRVRLAENQVLDVPDLTEQEKRMWTVRRALGNLAGSFSYASSLYKAGNEFVDAMAWDMADRAVIQVNLGLDFGIANRIDVDTYCLRLTPEQRKQAYVKSAAVLLAYVEEQRDRLHYITDEQKKALMHSLTVSFREDLNRKLKYLPQDKGLFGSYFSECEVVGAGFTSETVLPLLLPPLSEQDLDDAAKLAESIRAI